LWPNRQIIVALFIGACALTTTEAAVISSLRGTPPIAIEVRAEPITAFDRMIHRANDLANSNFAVA
jgi:hypothetical protein